MHLFEARRKQKKQKRAKRHATKSAKSCKEIGSNKIAMWKRSKAERLQVEKIAIMKKLKAKRLGRLGKSLANSSWQTPLQTSSKSLAKARYFGDLLAAGGTDFATKAI